MNAAFNHPAKALLLWILLLLPCFPHRTAAATALWSEADASLIVTGPSLLKLDNTMADTEQLFQSFTWRLAYGGAGAGGLDTDTLYLETTLFMNFLNGGGFTASGSPDGEDLTPAYTPIPEPPAWALIGLGLFAALAMRRRESRLPA